MPAADLAKVRGRSGRTRLQGPGGRQEGAGGHLRDRRCQVQDGYERLLGDFDLALLDEAPRAQPPASAVETSLDPRRTISLQAW